MTTTRARCRSSPMGDLVEKAVEARALEGGRRSLEALQPPRPEVEIEVAGGRLDEPPERPAVGAGERLQTDPRQVCWCGAAEVGLGPGLGQLGAELALVGGVAELEAGVVVA